MHFCDDVALAREGVASLAHPLGLVPTMGALHAGHLRLVQSSRAQCAATVATVFVNPMQFGAGEDFERYPRDMEGDMAALGRAGVDLVFAPSAQAMYPAGFSTIVDVGDLGSTYEGAVRPTHFRGVATIVCKLLHVIAPDRLYVGQKDAQQTAVLAKMLRDLDLPVDVRIVPTVRESDGLALSSRNAYLSPEQRAGAPTLYAALETTLAQLRGGCDVMTARERGRRVLSPLAQWEYLDVVDVDTFAPQEFLRPPAFIIGAARFGTTRLIDNLRVDREEAEKR